jgi:hypothetical protein
MLPNELGGIDPHHHVVALRSGDVAAVASQVPLADFGEEPLRERLADMAWLERTARRHEEVLETVARSTTPIPMRLCSVYRDEKGVRGMLEREATALVAALEHLAGKAEWGVKAFADPESETLRDAGGQPPAAEGDGAAYMQQRLAEGRQRDRAHERLEQACESIHEALCAVGVEGRTSEPQRVEVSGRELPMILNAAYLVADGAVDAFHAEIDRLRGELGSLGIEIDVTGPWPAYNFVPGAIGAAW